MDIRHQIRKTIAHRAYNKAKQYGNKIGKESNPRNVVEVVRSTYVISGAYLISYTLCNF